MREIKFRGFGAGKWRYGYYVHFDERPLSVIYNPKFRDFIISQGKYGEHAIPVDPETVGQFTGLHDKNGKEIYEGDIIQGEYNHKHLIRYTEDDARFTATLVEYVGNEFAERWNTGDVTQKWIYEFSKVVIGNIYDNKELLTQN
jgi:uncharacterized phage protein (TIGR01671 family)